MLRAPSSPPPRCGPGIKITIVALNARPGRRTALTALGGLVTCTILAGLAACAGRGPPAATETQAGRTPQRISTALGRPLPRPLYGVTVDDVSHAGQIVAGVRNLPEAPTVRVYFDVHEPARYYTATVSALRPVSYLMGELLDSADETSISAPAYHERVTSYLAAFRDKIDLWEIGNEVNGSWAGRYPAVEAKLTEAYRAVTAAGKRTALTLYYNAGCGDGPGELGPLAFSRAYVPTAVRAGLDYVLLSYYPAACPGARPSTATWTAYFQSLHALYPKARLGFGEIGLANPVATKTLKLAESLVRRYYGLAVNLPYYVGGYFWWYFAEDGLPYASKPLWGVLSSGLRAEASAISHTK
jgi:hypothetical protein